MFTTGNGLKIAYISGTAAKDNTTTKCTFNREDVTALKDVCVTRNTNFRGVDILLTSQWPASVTKHADALKVVF